jgi:hypothetical protein
MTAPSRGSTTAVVPVGPSQDSAPPQLNRMCLTG